MNRSSSLRSCSASQAVTSAFISPPCKGRGWGWVLLKRLDAAEGAARGDRAPSPLPPPESAPLQGGEDPAGSKIALLLLLLHRRTAPVVIDCPALPLAGG